MGSLRVTPTFLALLTGSMKTKGDDRYKSYGTLFYF